MRGTPAKPVMVRPDFPKVKDKNKFVAWAQENGAVVVPYPADDRYCVIEFPSLHLTGYARTVTWAEAQWMVKQFRVNRYFLG
jgi:hypothetical protein